MREAAAVAEKTGRSSGWSGFCDCRSARMRDTRMPSLAIHLIDDSLSVRGSKSRPSMVWMRPFFSLATPLWCSATTNQSLLWTGEPEEPPSVSVEYQSTSPLILMSWFSRTQTCLRSPLGCWTIVSHSPSTTLPSVATSGRKPKSASARPASWDCGCTATTL